MPIPALEFEGVTCSFVTPDGKRYTAVKNVDLTIGDGEFVSVVGPTGCGKSTLLNMAVGLLSPSKGVVKVFGEPLQDLNKRAGYMFQAEALMPWRTAIDNVAAGLQFAHKPTHTVKDKAQAWLKRVRSPAPMPPAKGIKGKAKALLNRVGVQTEEEPPDEIKQQALSWLARVGLQGFEDRYPHELSGGMRKRVALAQTLIMDPAIILMDEPFSALDVQTRKLMENEVLALWAQKKKAVLFITHDLDEAIAISDRVVVMSAGPSSHPIGEFVIDIARPRDVAEVRVTPRFIELHNAIWADLREEVLKGYENQRNKVQA